MSVQELKSSGGVVYSVQSTLPEAGGQVGEVPEAVSRVWHLGAPRSRSRADACEFMRVGRAPPFGVWFGALRWIARLFRPGKKSCLQIGACAFVDF